VIGFSAGGFESGYIAPDPLNPNLVYSIGWFGTVMRLDRTTGQTGDGFSCRPRIITRCGETPIIYAPHDPHTMYYGAQYLLKTSDGAANWEVISPDLTSSALHPRGSEEAGWRRARNRILRRKNSTIRMVKAAMIKTLHSFARNGAIHSIAPSPVEVGDDLGRHFERTGATFPGGELEGCDAG